MSKKSDDRRNVVIVGGGGYGAALARDLSTKLDASKYNIILVGDRPYYLHYVAAVRFTVTAEGKLEDTGLMPLDKLFINNNGTFVLGKVIGIEDSGNGKGGAISLQNGEHISYDTLVLATGTSFRGPLEFPESKADIRAYIDSWRHKYAAANDIVFVGGGSVGIETAGEIRDAFPNKKVTIVHGDEHLLNDTYPAKFRKTVDQQVQQRGINVIFNDYVDTFPAEGTVGITTRKGKKLPNADLIVPSFGGRPNTAFISTLGSTVLNERGYVKVNATLELPDRPGVFALGDIIDWPLQKQLGKAPGQVAVVSANIQSFLSGRKPAKLYKKPTEMIFVPVGKNAGAAYLDILWGITLGNWIVRFGKSGDLLIPMYRKNMGLTS